MEGYLAATAAIVQQLRPLQAGRATWELSQSLPWLLSSIPPSVHSSIWAILWDAGQVVLVQAVALAAVVHRHTYTLHASSQATACSGC